MLYGHGDDLWRYDGKVKHNFSTNIHSSFDHTPLMSKLAECISAVSSYPEPQPYSVERLLAKQYDCLSTEIMVTNGATEAVYMIAREFAHCHSAILAPTFREYQDACRIYNHDITFIQSIDLIPRDAVTVWICNPNNPTGHVILRDHLLEVINKYPDKTFVIDQAYADYTLLPTLRPFDAVRRAKVILLCSLTKRFAVPGLRIGYAVGAAALLDRLRSGRMPWSVSGLAVEGAKFLLQNIDKYVIDAFKLHSEALRISSRLSRLGIAVLPTDCNFILCRLPAGTSADLKNYLVEKAGILIRDASNFEGLDNTYFRVAAQSPEENDLLISEISKWLDTHL